MAALAEALDLVAVLLTVAQVETSHDWAWVERRLAALRACPACDGCIRGVPTRPCAITGAPVHDDGEYAISCRAPELTTEDVERVARYLRAKWLGVPWVPAGRGHWDDVARAAMAIGADPTRIR